MSNLCKCPRCGERSLELMKTYSHCSHCLYTEDSWDGPDAAYFRAMKDIVEIEAAQPQKEKQELKQRDKNENKNCA